MQTPSFAVVGHPNKGKSSIVATLAQDESVLISATPGTTVKSRRYPMSVDGRVLYELVDTPGFQRARRALAWLKEHETSVAQRAQTIRAFINQHESKGLFTDECELLTPIINGAGILYVVDGAKPYGRDYEAEMEILRWSGQPSMALINLIGSQNYVEEWRNALGQYFKIVRVFDALTAEFDKRLELLRAFGQLNEHWQTPLETAVANLEKDRERRKSRAAHAIATMLCNMLSLKVRQDLDDKDDKDTVEQDLQIKLKNKLRKLESTGRKNVEKIYAHHAIERIEEQFAVLDSDLFAKESWKLFGLNKQQLLTTAAVGGAAVGSGVDIATGGSSLLLGAGIGALIGTASLFLGFDKLAETKVMGLPVGGTEMNVGPIKNINFPYVVLGRALYHHQVVSQRTHAQRDDINLSDHPDDSGAAAIASQERRQLERLFTEIRKENFLDLNSDYVERLKAVLLPLLELKH